VRLVRSVHFRNDDGDGGYLDLEVVDCSPKSRRRNWILSIDRENYAASYATLQRSETDDSEFDRDVTLPRRMFLWLAISTATHIRSRMPTYATEIDRAIAC
jgi:hypothetical protein